VKPTIPPVPPYLTVLFVLAILAIGGVLYWKKKKIKIEKIPEYEKLEMMKKIENLEKKISELKLKGVDTAEMEHKLNFAKKGLHEGLKIVPSAYIENLERMIKKSR
jgi:predicted phosphohydrolase